MRAPLATRSNTEGGGSSMSKDLLAKVKAAAADKEVSGKVGADKHRDLGLRHRAHAPRPTG